MRYKGTGKSLIRLGEIAIQNVPSLYPRTRTKRSSKSANQSTRYFWAGHEGTTCANGHTLLATSQHHVGAPVVLEETDIP